MRPLGCARPPQESNSATRCGMGGPEIVVPSETDQPQKDRACRTPLYKVRFDIRAEPLGGSTGVARGWRGRRRLPG